MINQNTFYEKWQAAVPSGRKPLGLYIHIPFCKRKCRYCDFVSFAGCEGEMDPYVDRLCEEIRARGLEFCGKSKQNDLSRSPFYVDSIFLGGGTPSLLSPEQLSKIVCAVDETFVCVRPEFTVECNPGTVDEEKLRAMKALGVNRISLGVQSLSNPVLKKLGRIHDNETALKAMDMAAAAGLNYNVDLMFGVPGQTLGIWKKTLRTAVEKGPAHISFYSLQLEEDTPLYEAYQDGRVDLPEWEENREMYHFAAEFLRGAGYHHYEISNAALPGKECRHNIKYWTMGDYLGLGLAAYSFVNGKRFYNTADMDRYLYASGFGRYDEEPDETGLKGDWVFTALRLTEGFALDDYKAYFGSSFMEDFGEAVEDLISDGLLELYDVPYIRMTQKGLDYTNPVMEKLLEQLSATGKK